MFSDKKSELSVLSLLYFFLWVILCRLEGYSQIYLFPEEPWFYNQGHSLFMVLSAFFFCLFAERFLNFEKKVHVYSKFAKFFIPLLLINILLAFSKDNPIYGALLFNFLAPAIIIWVFLYTIFKIKEGYHPAKIFILGISFFSFSIIIFSGFVLGVFPSNFITKNILALWERF